MLDREGAAVKRLVDLPMKTYTRQASISLAFFGHESATNLL